jgi:hypothetical protein
VLGLRYASFLSALFLAARLLFEPHVKGGTKYKVLARAFYDLMDGQRLNAMTRPNFRSLLHVALVEEAEVRSSMDTFITF